MRKLLTFMAAICCTMFVAVQSAQAALPSDDAVIMIAGTQVEDTNLDDVLSDGGSVKYNPTEHVLTLDMVDINGQVKIDASANGGFPVTIKVNGYCTIQTKDVVALWYIGASGSALTIEGVDADSKLSVEADPSSTGVNALACFNSSFDYFPLIVRGIELNVSNWGAYDGYDAMEVDSYSFENCKLYISTNNSDMPIYTDHPENNTLDHVTLIEQLGEAYGFPYTTAYPVWVNGVQMSDGLSKDYTTGLPYLSSWEMAAIKTGKIMYDAANRTLILGAGLELNAEYGDASIVINDTENPTQPITVQRENNWGEAKIYANSYNQAALKVLTPTIVDVNGGGIRLDADKGDGIIAEADLTLANSQLEAAGAGFWIGGGAGRGITSTCGCATLTIDFVEMSIFGTQEVCAGFSNIDMKPSVKFSKDDDYEFKDGNLVDKGTTNVVTYNQIWFSIAGWYFLSDPIPATAGSVKLFNTSDVEMAIPHLFVTDEEVKLQATANEGWEFGRWSDGFVDDNPRTTWLWTGNSTRIDARFSRTIKSDETFYGISLGHEIYAHFPKLRKMDYVKVADVPVVNASTNIDGAVVAGNKLFYIEYDYVNDKSALVGCEFDGKEAKNAANIIAMQNDYHPIKGIAVNPLDQKLYLVAYKTSEGKDFLLTVNPASETAFTEVGELSPALNNSTVALTFDATGKLFAVTYEMMACNLYQINPSDATASLIDVLNGISTSGMYNMCDLTVSPTTGEMILHSEYDNYLIDPNTAKVEWISNPSYSLSALGVGPKRYSVTAKLTEEQDSWGYINFSKGYNPGLFGEGETIEMLASFYSDYEFVKWSDGNTDNPRVVTVGKEDLVFTATGAAKKRYTIETNVNDPSMGSAYIKYYGSSWDAPEGEELILIAEPKNEFYRFVNWDDGNTDNPRKYIATEAKAFTANFEALPTHTITVAAADGNGTVAIPGYSTPAELAEGMEVNITATATTAGYVFDKWDDGNTDNPRTITVGNADATYTASFKSGTAHTITVEMASSWKWYANAYLPGKVSSAEYAEGAEVEIWVEVDDYYTQYGYAFKQWNDGNTDNPRTITVGTTDATYTAELEEKPTYYISVKVEEGQSFWGTAAFEDGDHDKTSIPGYEFDIVAKPISDKYTFVEWKEDHNTDNPRHIIVGAADATYTAVFAKGSAPKHTITVEVASGDESKGDVNINGGGKSGEFEEGASITLNAIANSGYAFDKWNDDNTDEVRTIKVGTADATYTASFKEDLTPTHTITVEVAKGQEAMGDVDINGGGKSGDFAEGKKITLNAKPNSGYKFVKWNDENTDKSRSFTVGTKDETFIASFEEIPVTKDYPVTVADVTLNEEKAMLVAGTDLTGILKAGFISYDPATNTLTLNNVELELTDPTIAAILIDGDAAKAKVNIEIVGTCKVTAAGVGIYLLNSSMITLSGEGKLDIKAANGIVLDEANLTLNGIALNVDATGNGIVGQNNTENLIVNGAHISVKGTAGSICGLGDMERNYCSFQSGYKFENNQVEKGGSLATDAVVLDVWPMLTVSPVDKGSANFTLKSKNTGESFKNKGWFEKDDEVTITPEEADNFVFARWMDDSDWKDKDLRIKETRKITKSDKDETFTALFYFEPESSNDWFGVNNDEFIKFSLGDHAAKVARASNSLSDVKGGDYDGENWIFIEDATVNYFEFEGTLKDGEDILGKSGKIEKYCKKSISDATDMTIDFMEGDIYAVAESKLFEITKSEAKEIATFKLDGVETIIYAIAIDANGTMYALGRNSSKEAVLYTVSISDKEAKLKVVGKPENGGKVGGAVVDGAQALAFDLSTGELFWGAADYLRIIDTKKMQTFVVGDLGQKEGKQGTIKSLHCLTQMVEVGVTVAEGQESWGTASVDGSSTTGKKNQYVYESFLPGETVTITAEAKEGYHFDHWEIEGDKKHVPYTPATLEFEAEEIVYVAYFAEGEGIESITIDPTKNIQKVLVDGVIYILRDGYIYTVTGEKIQ